MLCCMRIEEEGDSHLLRVSSCFDVGAVWHRLVPCRVISKFNCSVLGVKKRTTWSHKWSDCSQYAPLIFHCVNHEANYVTPHFNLCWPFSFYRKSFEVILCIRKTVRLFYLVWWIRLNFKFYSLFQLKEN